MIWLWAVGLGVEPSDRFPGHALAVRCSHRVAHPPRVSCGGAGGSRTRTEISSHQGHNLARQTVFASTTIMSELKERGELGEMPHSSLRRHGRNRTGVHPLIRRGLQPTELHGA